jgi:MFS transporter, DHA1 family, inner membrane transport protein
LIIDSASPAVVTKFTATETVSVILLTVLTGAIMASEPVMLGAMLQAHRLTAVQLGHAATAEPLATAAMAAFASSKLRPERMKAIAVIAVLVISLANFLTMFASGNGIVLARLLSGIASGITPWLLSCMVVRSQAPARVYGATTVVINIGGLSIVQLSSRFFIPHFGASGPYGMMFGFAVLMLIPALLIRDRLPPLPKMHHASSGLPTLSALAALFAIVFFAGGFMACWVYLVPLAEQLGYAKSAATIAISVGVVCQILGSVAAATAGKRAGYFTILVPATAVALLVIAALNINTGTLPFVAFVALLCFVFNLSLPFVCMPFLIAADPSRRTAMYSLAVLLVGYAFGPFSSSLFTSAQSVQGSLGVSFCLFTLSLVLVIGVHLRVLANRQAVETLVPAKDVVS